MGSISILGISIETTQVARLFLVGPLTLVAAAIKGLAAAVVAHYHHYHHYRHQELHPSMGMFHFRAEDTGSMDAVGTTGGPW
jgi:hypothetical protein